MSRTDSERRKFFDYYAKLNHYENGEECYLEVEDPITTEKQFNP
jgi:hypothetical protein